MSAESNYQLLWETSSRCLARLDINTPNQPQRLPATSMKCQVYKTEVSYYLVKAVNTTACFLFWTNFCDLLEEGKKPN